MKIQSLLSIFVLIIFSCQEEEPVKDYIAGRWEYEGFHVQGGAHYDIDYRLALNISEYPYEILSYELIGDGFTLRPDSIVIEGESINRLSRIHFSGSDFEIRFKNLKNGLENGYEDYLAADTVLVNLPNGIVRKAPFAVFRRKDL